jgi:hypothetical protein
MTHANRGLSSQLHKMILLGLIVAWLVTSQMYYTKVVGSESGTNIFSVYFGWQWLCMFVTAIGLIIYSLTHRRKYLLKPALITLAGLMLVFVSARVIYQTRFYITGDGGPAGPEFSCIVWKDAKASGEYDETLGLRGVPCTFMSMPSYNKFLIDYRVNADQSDNSLTYYVTLLINEATVLAGIIYAYRKHHHRQA